MRTFKSMLSESFTKSQTRKLYDELGLDCDYDQFHQGMNVELEHKDVTGGDPHKTAKIVLAHLKEKKDYYTRLKKVEK